MITEYRSAIFTHSEDQLAIAKHVAEEFQAKHFTPKGENPAFLQVTSYSSDERHTINESHSHSQILGRLKSFFSPPIVDPAHYRAAMSSSKLHIQATDLLWTLPSYPLTPNSIIRHLPTPNRHMHLMIKMLLGRRTHLPQTLPTIREQRDPLHCRRIHRREPPSQEPQLRTGV